MGRVVRWVGILAIALIILVAALNMLAGLAGLLHSLLAATPPVQVPC